MAIDSVHLNALADFLAASDTLPGTKLAQYVKLLSGAPGSEEYALVSAAHELYTKDADVKAAVDAITTKLNASVVVTGVFFQATQPISAAALPLPAGAATAALQPALVAGRTPVDPSGVTSPISAAALPLPAGAATSALQPALVAGRTPVDPSGVTSPISAAALPLPAGAATSALQPALVGGRTPVDPSGVTSPVSLAALPALAAGAAVIGALTANQTVDVAKINGVTPLMGAGNTGTGSPRVTIATDQVAIPVTPPTLTKGTQGSTGFSVQALHDAGRANISIIIDRFAPSASAETIVNTMSFSNAYSARTTGQSSYPVTAAKTLRLAALAFALTVTNGNTTATVLVVRMRVNPSGAATISSAIAHTWYLVGSGANPAGSALSMGANEIVLMVPGGQEFPAGAGVCFTVENPGYVVTTANPAVSVDVTGLEY